MESQLAGAQNQDFRTIPRLWEAAPGRRALDLGAGIGLYTAELACQGAWAVGLDLELGHLAQARARGAGKKLFWVRGDAAHLPFRAGVFSLVVSVEVLSHLPPQARRAALAEAGRVVRGGGELFVTLHNPTRLALGQWLRWRRPQEVYRTANLPVWPVAPRQAIDLAHRCGLRPKREIRYLNFHSRFTYDWHRKHPRLSALLVLLEEVLARTPLVRRLGITFLVRASKAAAPG
jgi:SAM-dependent methyltransferase